MNSKTTIYDERYESTDKYWSSKPSSMLYRAIELMPETGRRMKALDIGCGEGTSAVFLARNGFAVMAFDLSPHAIQKTSKLATRLALPINAFVADINEFVPDDAYDLIFSSGTVQYLDPARREIFTEAIKGATVPGGLNVIHTFVAKPFIDAAPDAERNEHLWRSGELIGFYHDWETESFLEEIKECNSGGLAHRHAHNRIWTKKP